MTWQPLNRFDGVIDVSHYQGPIDWAHVKAAGIEFAFIKATQGTSGRDPLYEQNWHDAVAAGLMTSAYHFLTADDPAAQHRHFVDVTGGQGVMMVDWEIDPESGQRPPPPIATMEQFCRLVAASSGRDPLAYHGMFDLSSPTINAFPWMIPKYGPQPQGPKWLLWQYSPNGKIDGIATAVDRSVFAGTLDELRAWWRDGTLPAALAAPSAPQPTAPVSSLAGAERALQTALQLAGKYAGPVDGEFGRGSLAALAAVDPFTRAALDAYRNGARKL